MGSKNFKMLRNGICMSLLSESPYISYRLFLLLIACRGDGNIEQNAKQGLIDYEA